MKSTTIFDVLFIAANIYIREKGIGVFVKSDKYEQFGSMPQKLPEWSKCIPITIGTINKETFKYNNDEKYTESSNFVGPCGSYAALSQYEDCVMNYKTLSPAAHDCINQTGLYLLMIEASVDFKAATPTYKPQFTRNYYLGFISLPISEEKLAGEEAWEETGAFINIHDPDNLKNMTSDFCFLGKEGKEYPNPPSSFFDPQNINLYPRAYRFKELARKCSSNEKEMDLNNFPRFEMSTDPIRKCLFIDDFCRRPVVPKRGSTESPHELTSKPGLVTSTINPVPTTSPELTTENPNVDVNDTGWVNTTLPKKKKCSYLDDKAYCSSDDYVLIVTAVGLFMVLNSFFGCVKYWSSGMVNLLSRFKFGFLFLNVLLFIFVLTVFCIHFLFCAKVFKCDM